MDIDLENFQWDQRIDWHYLRLEIRNTSDELITFMNPVYSGQENTLAYSWGTLLEAYNKNE